MDTVGLGVDIVGLGVDTVRLGVDTVGLGVGTVGLGVDTLGLGVDTVGLGVDTVGLGQDQFQVVRFPSPPTAIPPLPRAHLHLHVDLIRKTKRMNPGNYKGNDRICTMGYRGVLGRNTSLFLQSSVEYEMISLRVACRRNDSNSVLLYYLSDRCLEVCLSIIIIIIIIIHFMYFTG